MQATTERESKCYTLKALANHWQCTERNIYKMLTEGRMPAPFRIGKMKRWHKSEIHAWEKAMCPPRDEWEKIKAEKQR